MSTAIAEAGDKCPDCKHILYDHDMHGCTLMYCRCLLSGMFLKEYFEDTSI